MDPQQTAILLSCVGVLVLALMLRAREAFNRACVRNVPQGDDAWNAKLADLRSSCTRLERTAEKLHQLNERQAGREVIGLPVWKVSEPAKPGQRKPPRPLPPTQAPQSKKKAPKAR